MLGPDESVGGFFYVIDEFGKSAYRNTKGRRVSGLSIGYAIRNSTKTAAALRRERGIERRGKATKENAAAAMRQYRGR